MTTFVAMCLGILVTGSIAPHDETTGFITAADLQPAPEGMPGEQEATRDVAEPGGKIVLKVEVTAKGNGWLTGPGLRTKVYDTHDDGVVFEGFMHVVALRDVDGDGSADVVVSGHELHTPDGSDVTTRQPVLELWLFDAETSSFRRRAGSAPADSPTTAGARAEQRLLDEVQTDFAADGRPLHPMLLERFMPSFKGGPPEVLELAIATSMHQATGLDAPAADPYRPDWLLYRWKDEQLNCSVRYFVAGKLNDETFVVRVAANYGGTASVLKVLVIRVHLGPKLFDDEPAPVVMTLERILPLPGLDATVEVGNNTVTIARPAREGVPGYERTHVIRPKAA